MKDHLEENSFILIEGLFWFCIFICWCFSKLKKKGHDEWHGREWKNNWREMKSFWFHMEREEDLGLRRKGRAPSEEGEGRSQPTAGFHVISANWWAVVRTGLKVLGGLCLHEVICRVTHGREYKVKWALGSITINKAIGGDGIPAELFQILRDDAVKVLHSICQQIWKTQQWPEGWKGQFSFQSQRKAMPKNAQTTAQLHSSHTLVK